MTVKILVFCTLIVISLVIVIVVHIKSKLNSHNQISLSKRRSRVVRQRHIDTYCKVDEIQNEKYECETVDEVEIYKLTDRSKKRHQEKKPISTIAPQRNLDNDGEKKHKQIYPIYADNNENYENRNESIF